MDGDFYPPMSYSPIWLLLGFVILAGLVGWALVIWAQTRPVRPRREPEPPAHWRLERLKEDYLARIDEVVRLASAGDISRRRAHQELSAAVRSFVDEAAGLHAPTMTLTDLDRSGIPELAPVTQVVSRLYPVEFGPERTADIAEAAQAAREVVIRWT